MKIAIVTVLDSGIFLIRRDRDSCSIDLVLAKNVFCHDLNYQTRLLKTHDVILTLASSFTSGRTII